jgi:hypothetical protein
MTRRTQRNQVLFRIIAGMAAKFLMVDFQVRHASAGLTSPAITAQHLVPQSFECFSVESNATVFGGSSIHETFSLM